MMMTSVVLVHRSAWDMISGARAKLVSRASWPRNALVLKGGKCEKIDGDLTVCTALYCKVQNSTKYTSPYPECNAVLCNTVFSGGTASDE